jgi:hypothetical protein
LPRRKWDEAVGLIFSPLPQAEITDVAAFRIVHTYCSIHSMGFRSRVTSAPLCFNGRTAAKEARMTGDSLVSLMEMPF